jgi:hypothetical protein
MLRFLAELDERGYCCYFYCTITGTPRILEPQVPDWQQAVKVFHRLARRTGPRHVQWRFDPMLFTDELDAAFYANRFREIAAALDGATKRCYLSFAVFYGKAERPLKRPEIRFRDPAIEERRALIDILATIADEHVEYIHVEKAKGSHDLQ